MTMSGQIRFHECSVPEITYLRGQKLTNSPINMGLVQQMRKTKLAWYPDNDGKPALFFQMEGKGVEWAFNTEGERDAEYARILAKFE